MTAIEVKASNGSPRVRARLTGLRPHRPSHRPGFLSAVLLLLGPLICLAGGRWGSYLGLPGTPLYLTDLLVASGAIGLTVTALQTRRGLRVVVPLSTMLLLGVLVIGFANSVGFQLVDIARDAAPFLYLLLFPYFVDAVRIITPTKTFRLIWAALVAHLVWFAPAVFDVLPPLSVGGIAGVPLFATRGDMDVLITGVTVIALLTLRIPPAVKILIGSICLVTMVSQGSRAGLIASALAGVVYFLVTGHGRKVLLPPAAVMLVCAAVIVFVVVVTSGTGVPEWAAGLNKLIPSGDSAFRSGQNTWNARLNAWAAVTEYTFEQPARALFGSGFGAPVISSSGAVRYLSGNVDVRQAHNFIVTWTGYVGVTGCVAALAAIVVIAIACVRRAGGNALAAIGLAIATGILVCGTAGVVVESPFGYQSMMLGFALAYVATNVAKAPGRATARTPAGDDRRGLSSSFRRLAG